MEDGIETTRTAVAEGVRVRKTIETGPDDRGTVTLDVDVEGDEPATVRLTEPALGSIPRDEIELHTDHGAEFWRVGETATFEREFDAGESYRVVYRVAELDPERFDALDADPIVSARGGSIDDVVDRERSDAVRDLVEGERESLLAAAPAPDGVDLSFEADATDAEASADGPEEVLGGTPDDATASADGSDDATASNDSATESSPEEISVDVPSIGDPVDRDTEVESEADSEAAPNAGSGASTAGDLGLSLAATPSGGVARVLLEELRSGDVDEETRAALRAELEPGRSQELRIDHLQSRIGEFAAYVDMLESFVDEHGTFEEAVGGMDATVESLDDEVDALRSELDALAESVGVDVDAVEADVEGLRTDVDGLREGQDALAADLDDLGGKHDDLEARVDRLEEQMASVDDRLDEFEAFQARLSGAFQAAGDSSS